MDGQTRASGSIAADRFATNRVERKVGLNERITIEVATRDFWAAVVAQGGGEAIFCYRECCCL